MKFGKYSPVWLPLLLAIVSLHAGTAQISLTAPAAYATEKAPLWAATGDFNGDGKLDLAVADGGSNAITIFIGKGDGTFQPGVAYTAGLNFAVNYIVAGDFNKDGKPDLLVSGLAGNVLALLPGKGDGTFGSPILTQLSLTILTGNVLEGGTVQSAVADFDGDGNLDMAVLLGSVDKKSFETSGAYILRGKGDGTFQSPEPIAALAGMETVAFATADYDGDGKPDLAVLALNSKVTSANLVIALGGGNGTFQVANSYPVSVGLDLVTGDVDGDGIPDLVLSGANLGSVANEIVAGFAVYKGKGDGSFHLAGSYTLQTGTFIIGMCLADLRGTGTPDMVAAEWSGVGSNGVSDGSGSILVMEGNGDGTFQSPVVAQALTTTLPFSLVSGDFNGDGRPDLAYPVMLVSEIETLSQEGGLDNLPENFLASLALFSNGNVNVLLDTTPPASFSNANAAGFQRGSIAQDSIVAAFGGGLAAETAETGPLGTTLGGVTINVKDSTGATREAPLFYVSPRQINYALPAGTATGAAEITITGAAATVTVTQQIVPVVPGLFTVNGIAAANVATYQNGKLTGTSLAFQVAADGEVTPTPVDVTAGQVYLLLYGTGIRHAASVTATVGAQSGLHVAYAAQGTYVGEDQINILLPASLKGAGRINVTLTADGQVSNPVQIQIE